MDEKMGTFATLINVLKLKEIKGKPEVFSFYLGYKKLQNKQAKLFNSTPLMFVIDITGGGKFVLAFDLFMIGKENAKRVYEKFLPFSKSKITDMQTFVELRDSLLKEFPVMTKKQMLKTFPQEHFLSLYEVPSDKVVEVIDKFDALFSLEL